MWTTENRARYDRSELRYPSDLTDDEWALIEPLILPDKRGGSKRSVDMRAVVNGLMYVLSTGCQWRALSKELTARSTVRHYFDVRDYDGRLERIHYTLYVACRILMVEIVMRANRAGGFAVLYKRWIVERTIG